jgi:hypothetical protein
LTDFDARPTVLATGDTVDKGSNLISLYEENGHVARTYIDWRLRVISMYFTSIGAIFAAAAWLFNTPPLKKYVWVPFVVGAATSLLFLLWNETISKVLDIVNSTGAKLEIELANVPGCYTGVKKWLADSTERYLSSKWIWRGVFGMSIPVFGVLAYISTRL